MKPVNEENLYVIQGKDLNQLLWIARHVGKATGNGGASIVESIEKKLLEHVIPSIMEVTDIVYNDLLRELPFHGTNPFELEE